MCVCVCVCVCVFVCPCQRRCCSISVYIAVSEKLKDKRARKLKGDAADSEISFMRTNTTLSVVTQDSDR